jgi:hypothetical protein
VRQLSLAVRAALAGLAVLFAATPRGEAGPTVSFDANVKEWSSSTLPGPGIYPIGGSGQINGGFVVSTGSDGAQIGLRGFLRTIGFLPQTNDGVLTATYFAPTGSPGGNLARWNAEFDIDLRGTGHTINDYTATVTLTDRGGLVTGPVDLVLTGLIDSDAVLYQDSENPGFPLFAPAFPAFDPNAPGVYSFDLKLTPRTFTGDTLEVNMNVDVGAVPEPSTLVLCLGGGGLLVLSARGRRYLRGGAA